ncbi:SCP2 sterol-binding domain-containing protein [Pseudogracilibacillus sp. SE30717A]|uniref:SCP2 sterol-binding domain-containing protein n=1 Tax=Pseudogracilibacillus sp. SE30717A TaxID=3098293 RepID=UPI00300E3751
MNIQTMSLSEIWEEIERRANEKPELIEEMTAKYVFHITGKETGNYGLFFDGQKVDVIPDASSEEADCSLLMNVDNFKKLLEGNLNSASAFMTGRLKVKGNIGLALKLENLLKKFDI